MEFLDEADVSVGKVLGDAASVDIGGEIAGEDYLFSSSTPGTKGSAEVPVEELQRIASSRPIARRYLFCWRQTDPAPLPRRCLRLELSLLGRYTTTIRTSFSPLLITSEHQRPSPVGS